MYDSYKTEEFNSYAGAGITTEIIHSTLSEVTYKFNYPGWDPGEIHVKHKQNEVIRSHTNLPYPNQHSTGLQEPRSSCAFTDHPKPVSCDTSSEVAPNTSSVMLHPSTSDSNSEASLISSDEEKEVSNFGDLSQRKPRSSCMHAETPLIYPHLSDNTEIEANYSHSVGYEVELSRTWRNHLGGYIHDPDFRHSVYAPKQLQDEQMFANIIAPLNSQLTAYSTT